MNLLGNIGNPFIIYGFPIKGPALERKLNKRWPNLKELKKAINYQLNKNVTVQTFTPVQVLKAMVTS